MTTQFSILSNSVDDLIKALKKKFKKSIEWFHLNKMVVNPDNFQTFMINRLEKLKDSYKFQIDKHKINSKKLLYY